MTYQATYAEWEKANHEQFEKNKMYVCLNCGAINDHFYYYCSNCDDSHEEFDRQRDIEVSHESL